MATITIEGKVFGQRRPLFTDFSLPVPPEWENGGERVTLRSLITRVVLEEVRAFQGRQEERRLVQALSRADIERGLMQGKIDMGGSNEAQAVEADTAVGTALQAFEDGLYYIFLDDTQQTELEQEVFLQPESRMTFLRLVALAGG